jgi:hypothetical protein
MVKLGRPDYRTIGTVSTMSRSVEPRITAQCCKPSTEFRIVHTPTRQSARSSSLRRACQSERRPRRDSPRSVSTTECCDSLGIFLCSIVRQKTDEIPARVEREYCSDRVTSLFWRASGGARLQ